MKRRSWSVAERQRIVGAAVTPGASVAGVARANGVNANLGLQMDPPFGRQAEIGRSSYWPPRVISA